MKANNSTLAISNISKCLIWIRIANINRQGSIDIQHLTKNIIINVAKNTLIDIENVEKILSIVFPVAYRAMTLRNRQFDRSEYHS